MKLIISTLVTLNAMSLSIYAADPCLPAYKAGNYPAAEQCLKNELEKNRSWNHLFGLGFSLSKQEREQEALPYLLEAEQKSSSLNEYGYVYSALGKIYNKLGVREKEYYYSMKYLDVALKRGDNDSIAIAYNDLGVYFSDSQPKKAIEYIEKSLDYTNESKKAVVYNNLAYLYSKKLNNPKKAEAMYLKAISLCEQTGDYYGLGTYKTNLGVFYSDQKRYSESKKVFEETLSIVQKAGLSRSEAVILEKLELLKTTKGKK